MIIRKNYDNVFLRDQLVGICSFLYESIKIKMVREGELELVNVPIFYSEVGGNSTQFLVDFYRDSDKYCGDLRPVDGNINKIPSGVLELKSAPISSQNIGAGNIRVNYFKEDEKELGTTINEMSARTEFIPIELNLDLEIKCSSEIQRMKIWEAFIKKLYKSRTYYLNHNGFQKIPCKISFPEDIDISSNFKFRASDTERSRPKLSLRIQILTYLPDIDETTERFKGNVIDDYTVRNDAED